MTTLNDHQQALLQALVRLTPIQQRAVEVLTAGGTHDQAGQAAGVTRETVTRWAGHHPGFRAALNLYRATLAQEQIDTTRRIRGKALSGIEERLDHGKVDPLAVLRVVGQAPLGVGPTLPEAVLDTEIKTPLRSLPPAPPPQGLDAILDSLENPAESDAARATSMNRTGFRRDSCLTRPARAGSAGEGTPFRSRWASGIRVRCAVGRG